VQDVPVSQHGPHEPPQPSLPQILASQIGAQQTPLKQTSPPWQEPSVQPHCPLTQLLLQQSPLEKHVAVEAAQRQTPPSQASLQHSSSLPQAALAALQAQMPFMHEPLQQPRS
jgi:hypothetical protein